MFLKKRRATVRKTSNFEPLLPCIAKGVLKTLPIMLGLTALLLLGATALLLGTKDPNKYHPIAALLVLYLVTFAGGIICTRLCRCRAPLLCAIALGVALLLLLSLCTLLIPGERSAPGGIWGALSKLAILPICTLGAMLAARKRKPRRVH